MLGPPEQRPRLGREYSRKAGQHFEALREEWAFKYLYPLSACSRDTFGREEIIICVALRTATVGEGTVML